VFVHARFGLAMGEAMLRLGCIVAALVFVLASNAAAQLYFSRDDVSQLYRLSTVNGSATALGTTGVFSNTVGLTETNNPDILLGSTWTELSRIQISTGTHTILGPIGSGGAEGFAWDPTTSSLYGILNTSFFKLNPNNGALVQNLPSAPADTEGLAYRQGFIYAFGIFGSTSSNVYRYSIAANTWSLVGATGLNLPDAGLAYDPIADVFYAKGEGNSNLYRINPVTLAMTVVGDTGITRGGGLAYVAIPEPASLGLLTSFAGAALLRRRKK
jgi:hypothetical protein